MKMLNFLLGLFLMLAGILIDSMLYALSDCHYVKTHQRLVVQETKSETMPSSAMQKRNNWITHDQMEIRRNAKWQARMKRVRDQKRQEYEDQD